MAVVQLRVSQVSRLGARCPVSWKTLQLPRLQVAGPRGGSLSQRGRCLQRVADQRVLPYRHHGLHDVVSSSVRKTAIFFWAKLVLTLASYIEAVEILYRLNTISISSHILLRAAQDLLAPPVVASITSLELVWDISKVPLEEGFTGLKGPNSEGQSRTEPIFSSLKFLRISFAAKKEKENWDANDPVTGLPYNAAESLKLEHLQKHTLPAIDRLLERMAPPEADVIFSCRGWGWYEALGTALLEKQGKKVTKSQNCELGGDKCWRVTPEATLAGEGESGGESEAGAGDRELEEGKGTAQGARREGFWIHRPPLTHWTSRPLVWPLFP